MLSKLAVPGLGVLLVLALVPGGMPSPFAGPVGGELAAARVAGGTDISSGGPDGSSATLTAFPPSGPTQTTVLLSGEVGDAQSLAIGTVEEIAAGTAAEQPRCAYDNPAPGCFVVTDGVLEVSKMPAHSLGDVVLEVTSGSTRASAHFSYTDVPSTPQVVAEAGPAGAHVSWYRLAPGADPVSSITVTPVRGGTSQPARSFPGSATSADLGDLQVGATYGFVVTATSDRGQSVPSRPSAGVVPFARPGVMAAPTTTVNRRGVLVAWAPPADDGHQSPTGYSVTVWQDGMAVWSGSYPPQPTSVLMDQLPRGTTLAFSASAENDAGSGPDSPRSAPVTTKG